MDKKTYISPSITIMRVNPTSLMEGSNTTNLPLEIDDSGQYSDEAGAKGAIATTFGTTICKLSLL